MLDTYIKAVESGYRGTEEEYNKEMAEIERIKGISTQVEAQLDKDSLLEKIINNSITQLKIHLKDNLKNNKAVFGILDDLFNYGVVNKFNLNDLKDTQDFILNAQDFYIKEG